MNKRNAMLWSARAAVLAAFVVVWAFAGISAVQGETGGSSCYNGMVNSGLDASGGFVTSSWSNPFSNTPGQSGDVTYQVNLVNNGNVVWTSGAQTYYYAGGSYGGERWLFRRTSRTPEYPIALPLIQLFRRIPVQ